MTVDSDSFGGTDGDPWDAGWSFTSPSGSGTYTVIEFADGVAGSSIAARDLYATRTADSLTDADVTFQMTNTGATVGSALRVGCVARYTAPTTHYRARVNYVTGELELARNHSVVDSVGLASVPAQWLIRLRVTTSGSDALLKARLWEYGTTEPTTWDLEYTDTSPLSAGKCGLYFDFGVTTFEVRVNDYVRTDLAVGTSAAAVTAAITASAHQPAPSVSPPAGVATTAVAAGDATVSTGGIGTADAEVATIALEAPFEPGTVMFVDVESSEPVEVGLSAQDPGAGVKASAETATMAAAGEDAGGGAGAGSSASTATFAIAGVNAGPSVGVSAEAVAVAMAAADATTTLLSTGEAAGGEAALTVAAVAAVPSVAASATEAGASVDAQNASVSTAALTAAVAEAATFGVGASDATTIDVSSPLAEVVSIALAAVDATVASVSPSLGHIFQPPVAYDRPLSLPNQRSPQARLAHRLLRHYGPQPRGRTVLKIDGVYQTVDYPSQALLDTATEIYLGGHVYEVEPNVAQALTAAGYTVTEVAA